MLIQYLDPSAPQGSQIIFGAMVFQNFDAYFYSTNTSANVSSVMITPSEWQSLPGALLDLDTYSLGPDIFSAPTVSLPV